MNTNIPTSLPEIEREIDYANKLLILLNGKAIEKVPVDSIEYKILGEFLRGRSIRQLSKDYRIKRDFLTSGLRKIFAEFPEELEIFNSVLEYNRQNTATVGIETAELYSAVENVVTGNITMEEAAKNLGIDNGTFRERMFEVINKRRELMAKYIEKEGKRRPDYSFINFRALLLHMLRTGKTQSQIGIEYGIPARRISREVEKLQEDGLLKEACKMQAKISWRRLEENQLFKDEADLIRRTLEHYEKIGVGPIIKPEFKTQEETRSEKIAAILAKADSVSGTIKEKAAAAGVSVSTLRRARIEYSRTGNSTSPRVEGKSFKGQNEDLENELE